MKSCGTCRFWATNRCSSWMDDMQVTTPGFFDYGVCAGMAVVEGGRIVYDRPVLINYNGFGCLVETRRDFFCNLWKGKAN